MPGYGTVELHIGQTVDQVRDLLGEPESRKAFDDQFFLVYRRLGIDIDLGSTRSTVLRLFFYKSGVEKHDRSAEVNLSGIEPGSSRDKVIRALGEPQRSGTALGKEWLWYSRGIQFDLVDGKVAVIIIFDSRRPA